MRIAKMAQFRNKPMYKRQVSHDKLAHHFYNGGGSRLESGNIMTENGILYSYAEPVACLADDGAVFITSEYWSVTTQQHIRTATHPVYTTSKDHTAKIVQVPEVTAEYTKTNDQHVRSNYLTALDKLLSTKKVPNAHLASRINRYLASAMQYAGYFSAAKNVPLVNIQLLHDWDTLFEANPKLFGYLAAANDMQVHHKRITQFLRAANSLLSTVKQTTQHDLETY